MDVQSMLRVNVRFAEENRPRLMTLKLLSKAYLTQTKIFVRHSYGRYTDVGNRCKTSYEDVAEGIYEDCLWLKCSNPFRSTRFLPEMDEGN